jgi:hypothetical protein
MKKVMIMFDERPSFGQIFARACEKIRCNLNDPGISIEVLLSHVASGTQLIAIYVKTTSSVEATSNRVWMFELTYLGRFATIAIRHRKIRRNMSIITRYIRI